MKILSQFQALIFSTIFGIIYGLIYSFFNRVTYSIKHTKIRILLDLIVCSMLGMLYIYLLFLINKAEFSIYFVVAIPLGLYIYQRYYAVYFLKSFETFIGYFRPIKRLYFKIKNKIKQIKLKRKLKKLERNEAKALKIAKKKLEKEEKAKNKAQIKEEKIKLKELQKEQEE